MMANFSHGAYSDLPVFMQATFESKARGIFGIPPHYNLSNDKLQLDDTARFARSTNPTYQCFFCTQEGTDAEVEVSGI